MTDEQINAAIAEACGWTNVSARHRSGRCPGADELYVGHEFLPDYCSDLNAMAEAEKTIFPYYATVYANKLARATKADYSDDTEYFCATARQRAEAFLMALGKWEEVQND